MIMSKLLLLVDWYARFFGYMSLNGKVTTLFFFFKQKTAYDVGLGIPAEPLFRSSKGPKPLQLKLLTTYIPKTSAFTLAYSTSQRLRTTRASARTFFTFRHYITPSARNF